MAQSMGWDKSRLSHQLTRMQERKLIERREADKRVVLIVLTSPVAEVESCAARSCAIGAPESARPAQRSRLKRLSV